METIDYVILGGGPSGIGAANRLGDKATIFEQSDHLGGLCSSFSIKGFRFDHAVHLSFTKDPIVLSYLKDVSFISHKPIAMNYYDGLWINYPAQNNLFPLPADEKKRIIDSFRNRPKIENPKNYEEWLFASYGEYFARKFPCIYTKKYWCFEAKDLSTSWCGERMYLPTIEEVEYGSTHDSTPNVYYAKEMRYPQTGGYCHFFGRVTAKSKIEFKHKVVLIDANEKTVFFSDGSSIQYGNLFYSLPLNKVWQLFKSVPKEVAQASKQLVATSMANVSIGFKREIQIPSIWFYIYDQDVPFARVYSPSLKSPDNAPRGKSSLQFEYYYVSDVCPLSSNDLLKKAENFLTESGMASKNDIEIEDVSYCEYANVVFLNHMEEKRQIVLDFLKNHGIVPIGRFGQWDYLWSDQAYSSIYNAWADLHN